ncbi:MAG: hypothetical protein KDA42_02105 [Planctomycetales bacterium]|nr:hypothetical protein [Planctomycetales bacterium]
MQDTLAVEVELVPEEQFAVAELVSETPQARLGALKRLFGGIDRSWNWVFGLASVVFALAILATIPVAQLLSLGYLLEAGGRVARSGRLRDGLIGISKAARIGSVLLGAWLLLWIPRLISSLHTSARLIDPHSAETKRLGAILAVGIAWVVLHVMAACARGGRLRHFLWPRPIHFLLSYARPSAYVKARDELWNFAVSLRIPYYFSLGFRGFVGGMLWLVLPISLMALGTRIPASGFLGAALLIVVLLYLPFLQLRMAAENRFRAILELRSVRHAYRRAPVAFLVSLLLTLALALPLYLLKIELIPREAAWLPSLLFVVSIFPARLLCGWALARAAKRELPRAWPIRVLARVPMLPAAGFYALVAYFTQYTSWNAVWSLYEQHAFLVPVPFLGG